jgi:hypothetical protein
MRKIESIEDQRNRVATYEMPDGKWVRVDVGAVETYGLWKVLGAYGYAPPKERVPVMQYGRRVGTLPGDFDPDHIRTNNPLWYDPRNDDLRREGDAWIANRTLGASDLDMVVGFIRDNGEETR